MHFTNVHDFITGNLVLNLQNAPKGPGSSAGFFGLYAVSENYGTIEWISFCFLLRRNGLHEVTNRTKILCLDCGLWNKA